MDIELKPNFTVPCVSSFLRPFFSPLFSNFLIPYGYSTNVQYVMILHWKSWMRFISGGIHWKTCWDPLRERESPQGACLGPVPIDSQIELLDLSLFLIG
jgi:hypothetical protein